MQVGEVVVSVDQCPVAGQDRIAGDTSGLNRKRTKTKEHCKEKGCNIPKCFIHDAILISCYGCISGRMQLV